MEQSDGQKEAGLTAKKKLMNIGPWISIPFSGLNGLTPCLKEKYQKLEELHQRAVFLYIMYHIKEKLSSQCVQW